MASIVVVHGVGKQYLGARVLKAGIAPALLDGIERVTGDPLLHESDIDVAYYGHWFRPPGAPTRSAERAWTYRDVIDGLETDLLMALWAEAAVAHPEVPRPDPPGTQRAVTPQTVQRALYALSKLLPSRFSDRFLIGVLKQVALYLTDDLTRERVQHSVAEHVTGDTRVLIGHSLGSVVAYEALCLNPQWNVRALVTLGSPLGMPLVFNRLRPRPSGGHGQWPSTVHSWTNICDRGDVVALAKQLGPLFSEVPASAGRSVTDALVDNGWRAHDIVSHLTAAVTGTAIADGLRG